MPDNGLNALTGLSGTALSQATSAEGAFKQASWSRDGREAGARGPWHEIFKQNRTPRPVVMSAGGRLRAELLGRGITQPVLSQAKA